MGEMADELVEQALAMDMDGDFDYPPSGDYFAEERLQPEYQQLIVSKLHRQTEKAYCVSGTVFFDTPYRGMDKLDFISDWLPKSQCIFTGNNARIPQWIVKSRWQQRIRRERQFEGLLADFKTEW